MWRHRGHASRRRSSKVGIYHGKILLNALALAFFGLALPFFLVPL